MTRRDLIKTVVGVVLAPVAALGRRQPRVDRGLPISADMQRAIVKANATLFNPRWSPEMADAIAKAFRDAAYRGQALQVGATVSVKPPARYATHATMLDAPHIDPDKLQPLIDSVPKQEWAPRVLGRPNPKPVEVVLSCSCADLTACAHPWPMIWRYSPIGAPVTIPSLVAGDTRLDRRVT